jgi:hypothetical protein
MRRVRGHRDKIRVKASLGNFFSRTRLTTVTKASGEIEVDKTTTTERMMVMKTRLHARVMAFLLGSALVIPAVAPAAEKDSMKDSSGMMKEERGTMKDSPGAMQEGKDAMAKDKMKADKSGKAAKSDDKMKMQDKTNSADKMKM